MKIRCLLVDDEVPALKVLQKHISGINGFEIVASCNNAVEAMDVLHEKPVDLIFLDIKMPKLLGTNFLRSLSNPPKVIFVTAYREYAVDGYDLDAVDYLVKPVSFERFLKATLKVKRLLGHEAIVPAEENKKKPEAFVYLKVDKSMQKIFVHEIVYIESWKDYVKVFLTSGKNFLVKKSISSMENLLSEQNFIRVHRSYIISMGKITGYTNSDIQLGAKEIPIGRLYKQKVMDVIHST
ncbi:MAG: response regulator transcription factor [Bacteroidetes bacterium]|nr:response regulator transcription factor [Bacteroidota bacterium]MBS1930916.1 response regulator transcription factor [Bacteroidota bacterium]